MAINSVQNMNNLRPKKIKKDPDILDSNWLRAMTPRSDANIKPKASLALPSPVTPTVESPASIPAASADTPPTVESTAPIKQSNAVPITKTPKNLLATPGYWGQKVGKTNIPLDKFVQLAGMTSQALAPDSFGGRLGKQLAAMGSQAVGERSARAYAAEQEASTREYEAPNKLLQQQLLKAQINKIEQEQPSKWSAYLADPEVQKMSALDKLRGFTDVTTVKKVTDEIPTKYKTYYKGQKALGKEDVEIDKGYFDREVKKQLQIIEAKDEPTTTDIAEVEENILRYKDQPEMAPQVALFNKYSNANYTYESEDIAKPKTLFGIDVPFTETTDTQWVKVPKGEETVADKGEKVVRKRLVPAGATTGTYGGVAAYTFDQKTFYDRSTGEVIK